MGRLFVLVLAALLILPGCGTRRQVLDADYVASLWVDDVRVPLTRGSLRVLVREINEAEYRRRSPSGPATHRLVLLTLDGSRYSMHRINDRLVEVGLRRGDLRKKFFLISPVLSELVRMLSDVHSAEPGP